jgi:hypothetical protein
MAGEPLVVEAIVTNTGTATWLPWTAGHGGVACGAHLYDGAGTLLEFDAEVVPIGDPPREVSPGESVALHLTLPPQSAGEYIVELDCVASQVSWFAPLGSRPVRMSFTVRS